MTPDRTLARRVAARLKSFNLVIDDSAGVPVARTVPGAFLDLVLSAAESDFAAPELMALLKHPLTRLGRRPADIRRAARALERGAFRDIYIGQGLAGVTEALRAARGDDTRRRRPITEDEHRAAMRLVEDLEAAFAPLAALFAVNPPIKPRASPRPIALLQRRLHATRPARRRASGKETPEKLCP